MSLLFGKVDRSIAAELQVRKTELATFGSQFDVLIETVLSAVQDGIDGAKEDAYRQTSSQLRDQYPRIRPYLIAYLKFSVTDAEFCLDIAGRGGDAFEAMLCSPTLKVLLEHRQEDLIDRLTRVNAAIDLYKHHLTVLSAVES